MNLNLTSDQVNVLAKSEGDILRAQLAHTEALRVVLKSHNVDPTTVRGLRTVGDILTMEVTVE